MSVFMDFIRNCFSKLFYLVVLVSPIMLYSQVSTSNYIPNVIPPSPNAASLSKFSDVPVSPYTGTADVTIPIYTIQAKGISVPVSLSYHTGGIKMKEEASLVGLGWALNAGGMVSRTIMGYDDFGTQGYPYFTGAVPQLSGDMTAYHPSQPNSDPVLGNYLVDFFCNYLANTTGGNEDFYLAFTTGAALYDMEPDIFTYSFPGHSGKFIITRAGKPVLQKQENIIIQFQSGGQSFTITDDQGNKFYFNTLETCQTTGAATPTTSWLLSKIITEQQDSVLFTYTPVGGGLSTYPDVYQTYKAYCSDAGLTTGNSAPTMYNNQILQSIDFSNGHLQFMSDAKRSDLSGASKLDSVILYSKNASGALTYLKQNNFYYSYFNSSHLGISDSLQFLRLKLDSIKECSGSVSISPYSFLYNNINPGGMTAKQSYSVDHWGYYNGIANTVLIPNTTCDFVTPPAQGKPSSIFTYAGANREPDPTSAQTFSLQQIKYPTGGSSVFTYQLNDYDHQNSITGPNDLPNVATVIVDSVINVTHHGTTSGTIDLTNVFPVIPVGLVQSNLTIKVAYMEQNNYTVPNFPYENSSGKLTFAFTGPGVSLNSDIGSGVTCQSGSPVCSVNIPVTINPPSGVYNWSAYIDASVDTVLTYSETHVEFQYEITQQVYNQQLNNNFISNASGLRIQNITNYTSAGLVASEKTYTYTYAQDKLGTGTPQSYSYGRLMSFPSYARYTYLMNAGPPASLCIGINLFSSCNTSLSSVIQGNIVGYDQVTEASVDPVSGLDIGKTIYKYYNSSDSTFTYGGYRLPGCLNIGNSLNGMLLSKIDYSNIGGNYQKVSETDNYYHTTNRFIYNSPKYILAPTQGSNNPSGCMVDTAVETEAIACFYPSLKSERSLNDSSYNYVFDQINPLNYVLTVSRNYYDNTAHYQVTRSNTIDSKGNSLTTHLKYPQDYISGNSIIDSMVGRNMVSETIEKQDSLYYAGSQTGYITGAHLSLYRQLSNGSHALIPDKIYKLDIQAPITNFQPFSFTGNTISMDSRNRQMASFDQYDPSNNMQQYTTTDQNPVSIIWDYVNKYPIAQAKNAVITDIAATSFEADGYGNWTPYTGTITKVTTAPYPPTGNNYYNLTTSATLSKSGLVSGNVYIVSYWSENGVYSISGGTGSAVTGKTINGWTYYEHKITASSTTLTISGTGAIDEVRLYPSAALMTTYTYAPLFGLAATCDADNKVTYYYYDGFGRLKWIKDQDGNIIKTFQYHYLGKTTIY
jgi:YD repeat-containing protein